MGWYIEEVIALYMECGRCRQKGYYKEENRGQEVIRNKQKWCGYQRRKEKEAAWPRKVKA